VEDDAVFVGGARAPRLDPELVLEDRAFEEAVDDIAVSDIDDEKHVGGGTYHSSTVTESITSPSATRSQSPEARPTLAYSPSSFG